MPLTIEKPKPKTPKLKFGGGGFKDDNPPRETLYEEPDGDRCLRCGHLWEAHMARLGKCSVCSCAGQL